MKLSTSRLFVDCLTALDHFEEISERSFRRVLVATKLLDLTSARRKVRDRWSFVSGVAALFFVSLLPSWAQYYPTYQGEKAVTEAFVTSDNVAQGNWQGAMTSMRVTFNFTTMIATWEHIGVPKVALEGWQVNTGAWVASVETTQPESEWDKSLGYKSGLHDHSPTAMTSVNHTGTFQFQLNSPYQIGARIVETTSPNRVWDVRAWVRAIQPVPGKKIRFAIAANNGPNSVNWQVNKVTSLGVPVGDPVGHTLQAPGAPATYLEVTIPGDAVASDYRLYVWFPGIGFNNGFWIGTTTPSTDMSKAPTGGETMSWVDDIDFTNLNLIGAEEPFTPTNTVNVPQPTEQPAVAISNPAAGGSVWRAGAGSGAALDVEGYREGIDKLIADRASARTVEGAFNTHYGADGLARAKGYGGTDTGEGTGTGAKTGIEAAYAIPGAAISAAAAPGSGSFSPFALVTSAFGTIDFNPQNHAEVVSLMAWIKAFFAWVLTVVYSYWVFKHFRELTSVGAVSQIRGHSLALGAGGQVSALGNAVVWTTIMLALPVVFTAALTSAGLEFPSLTGLLTSPVAQIASLGPGGAAAAALISAMVPWEVLILVLVGPIIIQAFSIPIYMGVQSAIRWLIA